MIHSGTLTIRDIRERYFRRRAVDEADRQGTADVATQVHTVGRSLAVHSAKAKAQAGGGRDRAGSAGQRHNARRIYERPIEGHGYRGSERTVRRPVAAITEELGAHSKEVLLPLEFDYGQMFEADWLEANVEMDGQLRKVYVPAARLRASRASF